MQEGIRYRRTGFKLPRHCEERSDVAIRFCRSRRERQCGALQGMRIATPFGLAMTHFRRWMHLFGLGRCPTGSAGSVTPPYGRRAQKTAPSEDGAVGYGVMRLAMKGRIASAVQVERLCAVDRRTTERIACGGSPHYISKGSMPRTGWPFSDR